MSEVLLEFVEPWFDGQMPVDALRNLVGMAVLAWNAALMPAAEQDDFMQKFAAGVEPELRATATAVFQQMVQRKLAQFASNQRAIFDFQVTMTRDGPHIDVLASVTWPHGSDA